MEWKWNELNEAATAKTKEKKNSCTGVFTHERDKIEGESEIQVLVYRFLGMRVFVILC